MIVAFYRSPRFQSSAPHGFRDKSQWQVHVAVATEMFNRPVLLAFPPLVLMLLHVYMRANTRESGNDRPVGRYRSLWEVRHSRVGGNPSLHHCMGPRIREDDKIVSPPFPRALYSHPRGASEGCFPRAQGCFCIRGCSACWCHGSGALPRRRESTSPSQVLNLPLWGLLSSVSRVNPCGLAGRTF